MKKSLPKDHGTPKDVFAHLLATVALAMSVIAFTTIWFQIVNIELPDPISNYYIRSVDYIRTMIATAIIGWPIYLFLARIIRKDIVANPAKQNIRVRKWLMYLTLFVASIVLIVDAVTLLTGFLGGELTTRFALKTLAVFVASGGVFGYYLWDVRRDVSEKTQAPLAIAIISTVAILATLFAGFLTIGSPAKQRALRLDQERIYDLSELSAQVLNYYVSNRSVPTALSTLPLYAGYETPRDPETDALYDYRKVSETSFELCAVFATEGDDNIYDGFSRPMPYQEGGYIGYTNWHHVEGRTCFTRTLDPEYLIDVK